MTRYGVGYNAHASSVIYVNASSREEAMEKADELWQEEQPYVCASCSGYGGRPGIELGEWQPDEGEHAVWESDQ